MARPFPAGVESASNSMLQGCRFGRAWTTLLFYVALFGSTGILNSQSWAQEECAPYRAAPLRVENATGVDMLRAAANCTDGRSLEADWAGAITLDFPIVVASGMFLSITGEDALAEVRGGSQTRMFDVYPGGELTLTQLKLSGGAAEYGGAIHSDSAALILDSCMFHGNVATDGDGGAVSVEGGNVTIVGGEFLGNNASLYGGAVAATQASSLVVQDGSTFQGNMALGGGALYCSGVRESVLARCSLSDTLFASNTATGETEETALFDAPSEGVDGGGAVAFLYAGADITGSVFVGNYAQFSGGAMLGGNGTDITVNGCKFENNTAVEFGGAIAAASMTLGGHTELSYNSADGDGGAVSSTAKSFTFFPSGLEQHTKYNSSTAAAVVVRAVVIKQLSQDFVVITENPKQAVLQALLRSAVTEQAPMTGVEKHRRQKQSSWYIRGTTALVLQVSSNIVPCKTASTTWYTGTRDKTQENSCTCRYVFLLGVASSVQKSPAPSSSAIRVLEPFVFCFLSGFLWCRFCSYFS